MKITVRPLTPERWGDLEAVFNARGCSVARGCWCMYYRETGPTAAPPGVRAADHRHDQLRALAAREPPPGLLAYRGKAPVGWMAIAPREEYLKLRRSPVMKPVDDRPVWSVVCFVVPSRYRRQGVARALLGAAVRWARAQGATLVEGYPVDREGRASDDSMWFGAKSMFDAAGFTEVARRKPARPVVRLRLD
jgi:GNAT superfamily N-acetyltransferase